MLRRIDLTGQTLNSRRLRGVVPRAEFDIEHALSSVRPIIERVRAEGDAALADYAEQFDGVRTETVRVPAEALQAALEQLDPAVRAGLEETIRRTRIVHAQQVQAGHRTAVSDGGEIQQRWIPMGRVGLYVPGGLAVYPSSVVMNVVPAQEAAVPSIAVTSPPQKENTGIFAGLPHPTILAACALLGVEEVYAVGGAQAVAMLAYGTESCEPVDLITGPGNIYVAAAKRFVKGLVGIDSEAGPTEIAILADDSAIPAHVAADLISQAEHDPMAASVLITDSPELAEAVDTELLRQVASTKHRDRVTTALSGTQSATVLVDDMTAGLAVVDAYAAEHLEIHTRNAAEVASQVQNAGAIFVGTYAPVSLGDYCAGSNHVLPTGGCACHSSGLGVHSFMRSVQVIHYGQQALEEVADHIIALAQAEDLPAHGDAISVRREG